MPTWCVDIVRYEDFVDIRLSFRLLQFSEDGLGAGPVAGVVNVDRIPGTCLIGYMQECVDDVLVSWSFIRWFERFIERLDNTSCSGQLKEVGFTNAKARTQNRFDQQNIRHATF